MPRYIRILASFKSMEEGGSYLAYGKGELHLVDDVLADPWIADGLAEADLEHEVASTEQTEAAPAAQPEDDNRDPLAEGKE